MNHDARAVLAVSATTFLLFGVMTALQRFGKWPTIAGTFVATVLAFWALLGLTISGVI